MYYYKLTEKDMKRLVEKNLITEEDMESVMKNSLKRNPREYIENPFKLFLNKATTIVLQSIHFYGGENFNKPHYFLGEIQSLTTRSAFSRFVNKHKLELRIPFTY